VITVIIFELEMSEKWKSGKFGENGKLAITYASCQYDAGSKLLLQQLTRIQMEFVCHHKSSGKPYEYIISLPILIAKLPVSFADKNA